MNVRVLPYSRRSGSKANRHASESATAAAHISLYRHLPTAENRQRGCVQGCMVIPSARKTGNLYLSEQGQRVSSCCLLYAVSGMDWNKGSGCFLHCRQGQAFFTIK